MLGCTAEAQGCSLHPGEGGKPPGEGSLQSGEDRQAAGRMLVGCSPLVVGSLPGPVAPSGPLGSHLVGQGCNHLQLVLVAAIQCTIENHILLFNK